MLQPTPASLPSDPTCYVVMCTVPDPDTGTALARLLVERRLAACVNIVPGVTSVYRWQAQVHQDSELLLIAKTDGGGLAGLIAAIETEHPYECPEAIAFEVAAGSSPYLRWIGEALRD